MEKEKNEREYNSQGQEFKAEWVLLKFSFYFSCRLNLCFCSINAQYLDASAFKISKETTQKYQQMLEDKEKYVVDELLDVRPSDDQELEFLTNWEGCIDNHTMWEKIWNLQFTPKWIVIMSMPMVQFIQYHKHMTSYYATEVEAE